MGSPCELLCEVEARNEARRLSTLVADEAWRIEDKFSRYVDGNIVDQINGARGKRVHIDNETARLIEFATSLYELSDGRFDITSGVLRRAWSFDGSDRVPAADTVARILRKVGWERVTWEHNTILLPDGMEIDFGGIGKEYAVDRAVGIIREQSSASCLVNFGGDLAVSVPPAKRSDWQVGIESILGDGEPGDRVVALASGALATSGDARRYLFKDGIRYGHILDPGTGWPVRGAPAAITVAADTCLQAGMLSTFAMLEGSEAEAFLDAQGAKYWCYRA